MKLKHTSLVMCLLLFMIASVMAVAWVTPAFAKKPTGAYIGSAKIAIVDGRPEEAIAMLDTLLLEYGPHAEGYYWMYQVMVDKMDAAADLDVKKGFVEKMVLYHDSLVWTCGNEEIKDKYRKKCDEFIEEIDETSDRFWKVFYNQGVEQIREVEQLVGDVANETDSAALAWFEQRLDAQIDSCIDNMQLAILLDKADSRTYTGIASAYEKMGRYETANEWLEKALVYAADSSQLLLKAAYNEINSNQYCEAIPYFDAYVRKTTSDSAVMASPENQAAVMGTMYNLTVCLNNCDLFDSAYTIYQQMLEINPEDTAVLTGAGRYHNQMARMANDSANYYREQGDTTKQAEWRAKKDEEFAKSHDFLKQSFELQPDNAQAAEEYAIISALLQDYEEAAKAFSQVTELKPGVAENWTSLGDCHVAMGQWEPAAEAYEKTLEIEPDNKAVIEQLISLYKELKNTARKSELEKKLSTL